MRVPASWGMCLVVSLLAHPFGLGSLRIGLLSTAQAQTVPKSLEEGGTDAAMRVKKNQWTVGVAGGQLSGTYMTFADELAQVLDDGDNLRVIPIVTYGAASNLDDLLYLRGVDVVMTQSDVFEYFRTQRKTPNLESRIHYIIRLPVSELHVLARTETKSIEDLRQEGELRAGRSRFEPDRDNRLSASGRAGRAGVDGQSHGAGKAQIGRTRRAGAGDWQTAPVLRGDSRRFRSSFDAHSLF